MKKTFSVDPEKVDEEFRCLVKDEMTSQEVGQLGIIVFKHKISKLKNRWYEWKRKVQGIQIQKGYLLQEPF
jgi:hypothetical protein